MDYAAFRVFLSGLSFRCTPGTAHPAALSAITATLRRRLPLLVLIFDA
jgi:hypothetical protein